MKNQPKTVSLVVPIYNEEEALPHFFAAIEPHVAAVLETLGPDGRVEIVFVDDGSRDRSIERIMEASGRGFELKLVKLSRNFRKDNALAAGLRYAGGDAVIPMDVDLQDPPELLPRMVAAWLGGAKVVNAKRISRDADDVFKRTTSNAFYRVFNRMSDYPIEENVGDFRLLDRQVVEVVNELTERVRFMKGVFSWIGFKPVTIEYERSSRVAGETKWNYWKLWNFALDGITSSSTLPIRMWTYVGLIVGLLSILYAVFLTVRTLILGVDVPGYASLMSVVLVLGAFNLIALGIIGEYLGRIAVEVRQRPSFIVEDVVTVKADEAVEAAGPVDN